MIQAADDAQFKQLTNGIIAANVGSMDTYASQADYDVAKLRAIYTWVRDNIRYIHDGYDHNHRLPAEVVRDVENILRSRAGDCDDHVVLVGAMVKTSFEGPSTAKDGMYSPIEVYMWGPGEQPIHIFPVAVVPNGDKIVMDTAASVGNGFNILPGPGGTFWETRMFGDHWPSQI